MIKVVVVSDIRIYCEGLSEVLSKTRSIDVIAAEGNFDEAVRTMERNSPDVILLDMTMMDSCRIAQEVMALYPQSKLVALAVPENADNIVECAEVGFAGYVAREASLNELIDTVIDTQKGKFRCPTKIAAHVFDKIHDIACNERYERQVSDGAAPRDPKTGLTRRELEIFDLIARGLSNKLISRTLNIEVSTVKAHVHNILVKLGVKSRGCAVSLLRDSSGAGTLAALAGMDSQEHSGC